jgi:hypothetical protein
VGSEFNARGAVLFFGGPADLARRLKAAGFTLSLKAIEKWTQRKTIPGSWLVRMASVAKTEGRSFDIHDFIVRERGND